jgi:hypothetical protein
MSHEYQNRPRRNQMTIIDGCVLILFEKREDCGAFHFKEGVSTPTSFSLKAGKMPVVPSC